MFIALPVRKHTEERGKNATEFVGFCKSQSGTQKKRGKNATEFVGFCKSRSGIETA